jgi:archaemetzincin
VTVGSYERVLVIGHIPLNAIRSAVTAPSVHLETLEVSSGMEDDRGRIPVKGLVRLAKKRRTSKGPILVITDRDLAIKECRSLFGFSDRRAGVAVVSTARLLEAEEPSQLWGRVRNVGAHELGHLRGLAHCVNDGCVMRPATHASELDGRSDQACRSCRPARPLLRRKVAALTREALSWTH